MKIPEQLNAMYIKSTQKFSCPITLFDKAQKVEQTLHTLLYLSLVYHENIGNLQSDQINENGIFIMQNLRYTKHAREHS
jgi:hypothetical protein